MLRREIYNKDTLTLTRGVWQQYIKLCALSCLMKDPDLQIRIKILTNQIGF